MRRRVACTPGWCMECSDWKTASLYWMGTSGRNTPVETSLSRESLPAAWVVICSVVEFIISATSGKERCAAAIAEKLTACASAMADKIGRSGVTRPSSGQSLAVGAGEIGCAVGGCCAAACSGLLKASPATFSWPGVCLMFDVNLAKKDSFHCWRADQGGMVRNRDVTSGFWSVSRQNRRPSSRNLKCLTALKAASSSLSTASWSRTPAAASYLRPAVEARPLRVCRRCPLTGRAQRSGQGAPAVPQPPERP
jgi:hypothetical protein